MQVRNTAQAYGLVSQTLHWIVALLILVLFGLGLYMSGLTIETQAQVDYAFSVFSLHKTLGLSVFFLVLLRIVWALTQVHPRPLNSHKPVEVLSAQIVHWLLYAAILAMPLTGWLHHSATQGLAPIWGPFPQRIAIVPQTDAAEAFWGWAHYATAWIMGGLVVLHIAGALKHALVDRDGTLQRMIPWGADPSADVADRGMKQRPLAFAAVLVAAIGTAIYFTSPATETHFETVAPTVSEDQPGNWVVDGDQSQLSIVVTQGGNPVDGRFGSWSARIHFDPVSPEAARVSVDIDVASLDLGGISQQAQSANFLNSASFPMAHFSADGFVPLGEGRFEANGQLELVGKTLPLTLSFTLNIEDDVAAASGTAEIIRQDYGIGSDDPMVGSNVAVSFEIRATEKAD